MQIVSVLLSLSLPSAQLSSLVASPPGHTIPVCPPLTKQSWAQTLPSPSPIEKTCFSPGHAFVGSRIRPAGICLDLKQWSCRAGRSHWWEIGPDTHKPYGQRLRRRDSRRKTELLLLDEGRWSWKCKERLSTILSICLVVCPSVHPAIQPSTYPPTHLVTQITR